MLMNKLSFLTVSVFRSTNLATKLKMASIGNNLKRGKIFSAFPNTCMWGQVVIFVFMAMFGWAVYCEIVGFRPGGELVPEQGALKKSVSKNSSTTISVFYAHSVDYDALRKLEQKLKVSLEQIESYWQISKYPSFLNIIDIPGKSWSIQKIRFMKLILEQYALSSAKSNREFVVGFSGSSVTAGHGNIFMMLSMNIQ
jgi:hypothetical protein